MPRPFPRPLTLLAASALAIPLVSTAVLGRAAADAPYTVQTLHFKVQVGPAGTKTCDVVGDVYTPADATPTHREPAILTTNGFGGSKDDQAGVGRFGATHGYVVLSYSGLGFGGSGCQITLDDPDYDGKAASQLVSYLGGASGIAYLDAAHTQPAPTLQVVRRDATAHNGRAMPNDPRVGMVGGSYGGEVQFAAASVDPRVDTIVPMITWNDLSYSLGPDNTAQTTGVSTSTPGAVKLAWGVGFSVLGMADGLENAQGDPSRLLPCPNFATFVCEALVTAGTTGFFQPGDVAALRHASVSSYLPKIRIPVLLMQGQHDTLFNLNEATATFTALRKQGTPVRMIWQQWGHSGGAAPGEFDESNLDPAAQYDTQRIFDWFGHYLYDNGASVGPLFAWFRDWVHYTGNAAPAYGTAGTFPVGAPARYYLSGKQLVTRTGAITAGSQSFLTPVAGIPSRLENLDAIGSLFTAPLHEDDFPGTFASWTSPARTTPLDVVGSPKLTLRVSAPTAAVSQAAGAAGQLVLFVRLQDVAPDGTASDIRDQIAPIRVPDVTRPFTVTLPGIVHQFAAGHQLRLIVGSGSINYRGGLIAAPVTIATGSANQVLSLPATP